MYIINKKKIKIVILCIARHCIYDLSMYIYYMCVLFKLNENIKYAKLILSYTNAQSVIWKYFQNGYKNWMLKLYLSVSCSERLKMYENDHIWVLKCLKCYETPSKRWHWTKCDFFFHKNDNIISMFFKQKHLLHNNLYYLNEEKC